MSSTTTALKERLQGTAVAERPSTPLDTVRVTLERMGQQFRAALPPQIPVEKFVRTTMTAVSMQPALLEADRRSLLASCMRAAQDGLMPDGREAALVVYRSKSGPTVQYMPMVGGVLKKIRNSGELASISANVVYANDHFDYALGDDERIEHKPLLSDDRGKPIAVYAIARMKDGAVYREVMSVAQVEKVRAASRAANAGPWVDWWDEMARKTVIRRLAKRLPTSADVDAMDYEDEEPVRASAGAQTFDAGPVPQLVETAAEQAPDTQPTTDVMPEAESA